MFRKLAAQLTTKTTDGRRLLFDRHPLELAALLESAFARGRGLPPPSPPASPPSEEPLGHPNHRSGVDSAFGGPFLDQSDVAKLQGREPSIP